MNGLNLDDSNPMAALLASAPKEPTILDKIYQEKQNNQPQQKSEEKELNIGLNFRQPSYSSLHGTVITKGGETVSDVTKNSELVTDADPVVVFDGHSDNESENEPIGLGVRQPSFVSLHGQIIPKGADSLADLHPVIEEVPMETPQEVPEENDEDDEDDPQVKIVKRLQAKNANRWAQIGYEPPQDLIPLVRAKSQAHMQGQGLTRNGYMSTSLTKFYMNADDDKAGSKEIGSISEVPEEKTTQAVPSLSSTQPLTTVPTPTHRKRSGSFGMKLGEASASMERMQLIIPEEKEESKAVAAIAEDPHEGQQSDNQHSSQLNEEEEEDENDNENEEEERAEDSHDYDESGPLYGHLSEIVTESPDSPVYQTLLSGENPPAVAIPLVKVALRKYLRICDNNGWEQESSFISNLIEELPQTSPRRSSKSSTTPSSAKSLNKSSTKSSTKPSTKSVAVSDKIQRESDKLQRQLNRLDSEYAQEAQILDEYWHSEEVANQYARASPEMHDLRAKIKSLQRQHKYEEAKRYEKKLQALEQKERIENERAYEHDYLEADRKLKEKYSMKREVIVKKFQLNQKKNKSHRENKSIVLDVKAPTKINRDNDIDILRKMTSEVLKGKSPSEINIDRIYSQTQRRNI